MTMSFIILGTYIVFRLIFALIILVYKFLAIGALRIQTEEGKYFHVTVSSRDINTFHRVQSHISIIERQNKR